MGKDHGDIKAIFCNAIEKDTAEERAAYLDEVCGNSPDLRAQIEELLALHDKAGHFLETPAFNPDVTLDLSPLAEGPGTVVGRYKLLEKIGEGGMAIVYMAEQQEPIRRKVALKIIKLGMDTKQVIARFEVERQALAMMDHPNIAKVLDAGATETGRPYFVMELVTGVSITEYCDQNNLSTKERLGLFIQVCSAVQHAHQKGIIHRDIKPSNVMVTHHDGKPVPKVIDFGIAKAINQRLTEKTLFTRYAHIIGTPAYMSPEQAELSDLDIDTRSDIYSLGVLLYELLTGTTPFSEEELRKAGYIEMQRVIREEEPVKPSTKLTTLGETLTEVAKHHSATPDVLRKAVRGDLDWIVMKTLEKDRARRYETANGLALDIQRHLEHRPVSARAPSTMYRLHKFLRRNRTQAIAALTMVVVVSIVIILYVRSQHEIRLAEAEAMRETTILSEARRLIESGEYAAARKTLRPILESAYTGLEARVLFAGIMVDGHDPDRVGEGIETVMEKHYRERVQYYAEKIKANPQDANSYLQRAQQYYYLHDYEKANADVRQYSGILSQGKFFGFRFSTPTNLGPVINTSIQEFPWWVTPDGLQLWFERSPSNWEVNEGFVATRATKDDPWGTPVSVGLGNDPSTFKTLGVVPGVTTGDGLEMYLSDVRAGGYGSTDLYMMRREMIGADWCQPINLGPAVNSSAGETYPAISLDGLELYFDSGSSGTPIRPGGYGSSDLWVTKRATRNDPWGTPVNLGPRINSPVDDEFPRISPDGRMLYFFSGSSDPATWGCYQAPIIPVVDFNGDGIVELKDFSRLAQYWGQDEPSVDIGPMPWGDGTVDIQDLAVLVEYWLTYPGTVAHWKLDETEGNIAHDSARDHNGVVNGNPVWRPAGGKMAGALELDGIDDYISVGSVLNPANGALSVFLWVRVGGPGQVTVSQQPAANSPGSTWLAVDALNGKLITGLMSPQPSLVSDFVITDGQWHEIGLVWDGGRRALYVDGIEVAKDIPQIWSIPSDGGLHIGAGPTLDAGSFWSGLIDDVRIYDRAVTP